MKEIVINACYGGFGLSHEAIMLYAELKGFKLYPWIDDSTKKIYGISTVEEALNRKDHPIIHYSKTKNNKESDGNYFSGYSMERDDPILIEVVKKLGKKANTSYSELKIVKIPNDVEWEINEYDGSEHIAEKHRTWS